MSIFWIVILVVMVITTYFIVHFVRRKAEFNRTIAEPATKIWRNHRRILSEFQYCGSGLNEECADEARSLQLAIRLADKIIGQGRPISDLQGILKKVPVKRGFSTGCINAQMQGSDPVYINEDTTLEFPDPDTLQRILENAEYKKMS